MKFLPSITDSAENVFMACINGIRDRNLAQKFLDRGLEIAQYSSSYKSHASNHQLHQIHPCSRGHANQLVLGTLTKQEFKSLYSDYMVAADKPARIYYDKLLMLAPLGKCPLCGIGQASTLDHFLSKSLYPLFSVLTDNLVPACKDCNTGKHATIATQQNLMLHPYFEDSRLESDQWLYAEIRETSPATAGYVVTPPQHWSADLTSRVNSHFTGLDLERRFSVEAASELVSVSSLIREFSDPSIVGMYLNSTASSEHKLFKNSWKSALYTALSRSQWYQTLGYQY